MQYIYCIIRGYILYYYCEEKKILTQCTCMYVALERKTIPKYISGARFIIESVRCCAIKSVV